MYCANNPVNYVDPNGHKYTTRKWEMVCTTYWYDVKNVKCYGAHGNVHYAKSKNNKHLKKYKKMIDKGVLVDSRKGVKAIQDCIS